MKTLLFLSALAIFSGCTSKSSNTSASAATGSVLLTWSAGTGYVDGYYVEEAAGTSGSFGVVQTVAGTATSTTITGLAKGTAYQFRVRAFNNGGSSGYTSTIAVTP